MSGERARNGGAAEPGCNFNDRTRNKDLEKAYAIVWSRSIEG